MCPPRFRLASNNQAEVPRAENDEAVRLGSGCEESGRQLEEAVRLCAQTDFAMKNTGADDAELLKELLLRIAVGGAA